MSENTGQGSSGGWRLDNANPTADLKSKDYQQDAKVSAFKKRQAGHVFTPLSVRAQRRQRAMARKHTGLKPMRFVSLHHHSTYSFLDGYQLPEAHVRRATEINMSAMGMTEHGNNFSHVKHELACQETGVKPLFGVEFYMGWTDERRRTQKKNHLTVLAKDQEGYRNLMTLITLSWAEGFYHEPTVDWRWLVEYQKGLVVLSGCQGSALFTALVGGKHVEESEAGYRRGLKVARWLSSRLDDFYVEVQAFPELEKTRLANPLLARVAREVGRRLVATVDVHYTAPEEVEIQKILHNVRPGNKRTLEDQVRDWGYDAPLCLPPTDKSIYRRLRQTGLTKSQAVEAIVSTEEISQQCNVALPRHPRVQYPTDDPVALWREWLREGWLYRKCNELPAQERARYRKQIAHEMELIEAKDFVGYFLMVADFVRFAKEQQIPVGPARGSAAASLCCWLLRITEVNPLLFPALQFERFIDQTRQDMPDIDLDFDPAGLPLIREYGERKYGEDCIGSVGTFSMYKPKKSLDDVSHVFHIPKFEVEKVKALLLERSKGDLRASATVQDTMEQFEAATEVVVKYPDLKFAMDLEGNARGFGIHAAGLVVSAGPLTNICATLERVVKNDEGEDELRRVISMDKYDAERQGLEKLDFLSLKTMAMIAYILDQIGEPLEFLYDIPLDDEETLRGFQENDVVGVFQFDGRTTKFVNGILKPDDFHEVALGVTLSRPGPMLNGATQAYIQAKNGGEVVSLHPAMDAITGPTRGQIVFQEQVLRVVRDIGGFGWTHRAEIRRIMSKKMGEQEFNRQWHLFRDGALTVQERGDWPSMDKETARAIWNIMITAGSYTFNAAHAYSYGMLSWWTMFLKRHFPSAFYAGGLAKLPPGEDGVRHDALIRDTARKDIALLPPDKGAGVTWRAVGDKTLVAGYVQVPGIGHKIARKMAEFEGDDFTQIPGVGPGTVAKLEEFRHKEDPFGVLTVERALAAAREAVAEAGLPVPTHTAAEALAVAGGARGMVLLVIPTHRNLRELFEVHRARFGEELDRATVKDPDMSEWVLMPCRDETESIQLIFARKQYPRFRRAIWDIRLNKDVLLVEGFKMKDSKGDKQSWGTGSGIFHVTKLWVIDPEVE